MEQNQEEFSAEDELQGDDETSFTLLDAAIEFKMKGLYPERLSSNQKHSVIRKAKDHICGTWISLYREEDSKVCR